MRLALEAATRRVPGAARIDPTALEVGTWRVLEQLVQRAPLLVIIDDVQWVDSASLRALTYAVRRLPATSRRLLLSRRDDRQFSVLEAELLKGGLDLLTCGPLPPGPLAELSAARLQTRFPAWVLKKLTEQSRGNPLFALEYGLALRERGLPEYGAPLDLRTGGRMPRR